MCYGKGKCPVWAGVQWCMQKRHGPCPLGTLSRHGMLYLPLDPLYSFPRPLGSLEKADSFTKASFTTFSTPPGNQPSPGAYRPLGKPPVQQSYHWIVSIYWQDCLLTSPYDSEMQGLHFTLSMSLGPSTVSNSTSKSTKYLSNKHRHDACIDGSVESQVVFPCHPLKETLILVG